MYKIDDIKNKILRGDALSELKKLPSESVDMLKLPREELFIKKLETLKDFLD